MGSNSGKKKMLFTEKINWNLKEKGTVSAKLIMSLWVSLYVGCMLHEKLERKGISNKFDRLAV